MKQVFTVTKENRRHTFLQLAQLLTGRAEAKKPRGLLTPLLEKLRARQS